MTEDQKIRIKALKEIMDDTLKAMGLKNCWAIPSEESTAQEMNENDEVENERTGK